MGGREDHCMHLTEIMWRNSVKALCATRHKEDR